MKIGIDIMGGDYAPDVTIAGSILAVDELPSDVKLVLYGNKELILKYFKKENFDSSKVEIVNSTEVIEMSDHPAKGFAKKPQSSIALGFKDFAKKEIKGFASAGNTGAMLVGAMYTIKQVPGVIRPCITGPMPQVSGGFSILLDVGINPDCRPDVLQQYAKLGSLYIEHVYGIKNPKVALLNIGEEPEKGNLLVKATYDLLKDDATINFAGNIEGNEIFTSGKADVVVTDGFTGNVVLKQAEAFYSLIKKRKLSDEYFDKFNPDQYGGTPILGVNGAVIIGHGTSNAKTIKNMIMHTWKVANAELTKKITEAFKNV